jgi:hypothetical protein
MVGIFETHPENLPAGRFFAIVISMAFHPMRGIKPPHSQKSVGSVIRFLAQPQG